MGSPDAFTSAYEEARRQWPRFEISLEKYASHARARGHVDAATLGANVGDLYLALGCALSLPQALQALELQFIPKAREALLRRGNAHSQVDEVLQMLRERLLVGREGALPRIGEYDARGPLTAWLRTTAVRVALNSVRGGPAQPPVSLGSELVAPGDLELQALKARHQTGFTQAVAAAMELLGPRERSLLRMHLLDGVTSDQLARAHSVSRSTMTRWIKAARDALAEKTRQHLREQLGMSEEDYAELVPQLLSQLDLSVRRLLESDRDRDPSKSG